MPYMSKSGSFHSAYEPDEFSPASPEFRRKRTWMDALYEDSPSPLNELARIASGKKGAITIPRFEPPAPPEQPEFVFRGVSYPNNEEYLQAMRDAYAAQPKSGLYQWQGTEYPDHESYQRARGLSYQQAVEAAQDVAVRDSVRRWDPPPQAPPEQEYTHVEAIGTQEIEEALFDSSQTGTRIDNSWFN